MDQLGIYIYMYKNKARSRGPVYIDFQNTEV